jgi:hypothetical protein
VWRFELDAWPKKEIAIGLLHSTLKVGGQKQNKNLIRSCLQLQSFAMGMAEGNYFLLVLLSSSELHSLELESKVASKTFFFQPLVLALKEGSKKQEFSSPMCGASKHGRGQA